MRIFSYILMGIFLNVNQSIVWKDTKDWNVYKTGNASIFKISVDSLNSYPKYRLNEDSIAFFLDTVVLYPQKIRPVWMGGFLVSCKYNGQVRKVLVSSYGGFFYDQSSGHYFQIPIGKKDEWFGYINGCLASLRLD